MQRCKIHICFTVVVAFALGSCVLEDNYVPCPESSRVLLVYVGTDNNLSGYEQEKLAAIRDGWTGNPNDRIIVYRDNRSGDARLMEISNLTSGEQPREIAIYGIENSASPQTLNRVITDVLDMYPSADSYGLLVFSHASGWLPQSVYNEFASGRIPQTALTAAGNSRSIIVDGNDEMKLKDFAVAIPDGVFDYIVFETCFMAGIEVAYELRHKTPLILASSTEIVDPGFAPVYSSASYKLFDNNLLGFGASAFSHVLSYADNIPPKSLTLSVIRTAGLNALASFIASNCDFSRTVDIADIQRFDRLTSATLFFDFEDYYSRLLDTDAKRTELSRLIANCVAWEAATGTFLTQSAGYNGFSIEKHSGLTCYIPQTAFTGLNEAYGNLGWAKAVSTGNNEWLQRGQN